MGILFSASGIVAMVELAIAGHMTQKRKYTGIPYLYHPLEVATIVTTVNHTWEMVAAAIGHDLLEDTPFVYQDVVTACGETVAGYVLHLTDQVPKEAGNREYRKAKERERLARIPPEVQTIKLADMISNGRDIVEHDQKFARTYLREMSALLEVMVDGDPVLYQLACKTVDEGMMRVIMPD